jgi:FAD:protein FMN transferase
MTGNATGIISKKVIKLMGNRFEFTVIAEDEEQGSEHIDAAIKEVQRIEKLLTTFSENSQTASINNAAGENPVVVDDEVFQLIRRSLRISDLTQGAFDISYGSMDKKLWNFDKEMTSLPSKQQARESVSLINYKNIVLDEMNHSVFLKRKGMRIGFGGIGKGYAAEKAKSLLLQRGVESGVVNAAGDLTAWGRQPDGSPWTIGIAAPDGTHHPFSTLEITNKAVATSGNYEKFVMIEGIRYSHTIDPRTGFPVRGIKSVTVICPNAEIADAMATPVMVMGIETGLDLVNQVRDLECMIIDEHDRLYTSRNIKLS